MIEQEEKKEKVDASNAGTFAAQPEEDDLIAVDDSDERGHLSAIQTKKTARKAEYEEDKAESGEQKDPLDGFSEA